MFTLGEDNYRCIVMGLFMHYFFMAQFTWMMTQVFYFIQVCVILTCFKLTVVRLNIKIYMLQVKLDPYLPHLFVKSQDIVITKVSAL